MRLGGGGLYPRNGVALSVRSRVAGARLLHDRHRCRRDHDRTGRGCLLCPQLAQRSAAEWLDRAFIRRSQLFCLAPEFRQGVELVLQDIRRSMPEGPFDLILCRNLVFTYFGDALQRGISDQLQERLRPGWLSRPGRPRSFAGRCQRLGAHCSKTGDLSAGGMMQSSEITDKSAPAFSAR